jgi:hypothetical protein
MWRSDQVAPLFAKYQVDLAVQGHNHVYERSNPLVYDAKTNSARSSKQAVAHSPAEPAEVQPARDGTTYVTVGTAGTPATAGPAQRDRPQLRGRGRQRLRRRRRRQEADRPLRVRARLQPDVRDGRLVAGPVRRLRLHRPRVTPAPAGARTTMTLRFINSHGRELDRAVFSRTAGACLQH